MLISVILHFFVTHQTSEVYKTTLIQLMRTESYIRV